MNALHQVTDKYTQLNKLALKGEVAVIGSTFMAGFDFGEFIQRFGSTRKFYNRSVKGLKLEDAKDIYDRLVKAIEPKDIVIALGEEDIVSPDFDEVNFIRGYRRLVEYIKLTSPGSRVYVASMVEQNSQSMKMNERLEAMAKDENVEYLGFCEALQIKVDGMEHFFLVEKGKPTIMGYIVLWNKLTRTCEMNTWTIDDPWQKVGASNAISMCMEAM